MQRDWFYCQARKYPTALAGRWMENLPEEFTITVKTVMTIAIAAPLRGAEEACAQLDIFILYICM